MFRYAILCFITVSGITTCKYYSSSAVIAAQSIKQTQCVREKICVNGHKPCNSRNDLLTPLQFG